MLRMVGGATSLAIVKRMLVPMEPATGLWLRVKRFSVGFS